MIYVLYSSMINDNKTKDSDMKLKPPTRAGLRALYNLSMYDTKCIIWREERDSVVPKVPTYVG